MQVTDGIVSPPADLFVSPRCRTRPLSENALSFFLREVVAGASGSAVSPAPRAHSIRGVGTSCTFHRIYSVQAVLEAAPWRGNVIFASFYLNVYAFVSGDSSSLGAFVSAGQISGSSRGRRHQT